MDPGSVTKHGAVADGAAAAWVRPTKHIRRGISSGVEAFDHSAALATNFGVFADHRSAVSAEHPWIDAHCVERTFGKRLHRAWPHKAFARALKVWVNAIRRVSVERGYDPRDFVLNCAGGATGAHITALAREMGIKRVLISKLASGLCAYGQIISDVKYNYMAPAPIRLDAEGAAQKLDGLFSGLETKGVADLTRDGFTQDRISIRRSLDMRYVGQVHECTVEIDPFALTDDALIKLIEAFHARHEELYTYSERQSVVEIVNVESAIWGRVDRPNRMTVAAGKGAASALEGTRPMIFDAGAVAHDVPVYAGARLGAGDKIIGPAVIEEITTTLVIEPNWQAELHESGVYLVDMIGA